MSSPSPCFACVGMASAVWWLPDSENRGGIEFTASNRRMPSPRPRIIQSKDGFFWKDHQCRQRIRAMVRRIGSIAPMAAPTDHNSSNVARIGCSASRVAPNSAARAGSCVACIWRSIAWIPSRRDSTVGEAWKPSRRSTWPRCSSTNASAFPAAVHRAPQWRRSAPAPAPERPTDDFGKFGIGRADRDTVRQ
jgi:hypothetical protein